jgi:signal transduction histidine kinase/CheY-like chemotaxis protein
VDIYIVLGVSVALQISAAVLALRLIRVTGSRWAWISLAVAILLMALRRSMTLFALVQSGHTAGADLSTELVALLISVLMVGGLAGIGPVIRRIQEKERYQRRLELRIHQAQKLESLAALAGGVAHDFNNLLAGMLGSADLARRKLDDPREAARHIGAVVSSARHAEELTGQLLAYAGGRPMKLQPVPVDKMIRESAGLIAAAVGARAEVRFELGAPDAIVEGDPGRLRQVLLNLVTNAAEAVQEPHGLVTVQTHLESNGVRGKQPLSDDVGTTLHLQVQDTGAGMDPETQARVFEPFFSTKFTGRGLGLAAVCGIVQSHGGTVEVESLEGRGSTFEVTLPAERRRSGGPVPEASSPVAQPPGPSARSGEILVVDDEPAVREILRESLEELGYRTRCLASGRAAVDSCSAGWKQPVAILLDLTMPELDGIATLEALREAGCTAPVVLMSGYAEAEVRERVDASTASAFLHKPFDLDTLEEELVKVVSQASESASAVSDGAISAPACSQASHAQAGV